MKKNKFNIAVFTLALFSTISFSSKGYAQKNSISEMATDICGCFGKELGQFSPEFSDMMIDAAINNKSIESTMNDLMTKNPDKLELIMKDLSKLGELSKDNMGNCMEALSVKYKTFNPGSDEKELLKKLSDEMKNLKDCKLPYALFLLGIQQMSTKNIGE